MNGTLGTIIDFNEGKPVVETYSGKEILVEDESWHIEEEGKQKDTDYSNSFTLSLGYNYPQEPRNES